MIDIHCHALFGVDDGARFKEDSIAMLKEASKVGVSKVIFTPHYMEDGYKTKASELDLRFEDIKKTIAEENIGIDVFHGEEVFAFYSLDEALKSGEVLSLNGTRYVLVEFPMFEDVSYIDDVIFRVTSMGMVPVVAHPERYEFVYRNFDKVSDLISKGALMQINANSLVGRYGKRAEDVALKMLRCNMVHFVGSDAHSVEGFKLLKHSLVRLKEFVGEEKFREITVDNQNKLINNETILPGEVSNVFDKPKFWSLFKNLTFTSRLG